MTRVLSVCVIALLAGTGLAAGDLLQSLIDAEHEFAKAADEKGVRDAFLEVLTDDGILFRPDPVNGKAYLEISPAPPGLLEWEPVHAEVSRLGDLGYTTGPWRYDRREDDSFEPVYGQYVSIWGRQKDGSWKLVLDEGTTHEEPPESAWKPETERFFHGAGSGEPAAYEALEQALLEADQRFAKLVSTEGPEAAFAPLAHPDIRLVRDQAFPAVGWPAVQKMLHGAEPLPEPSAAGMGVSVSGDLGYTYGTAPLNTVEPATYVRIWRGDGKGEWKIVFDMYRKVDRPRRKSQLKDQSVD